MYCFKKADKIKRNMIDANRINSVEVQILNYDETLDETRILSKQELNNLMMMIQPLNVNLLIITMKLPICLYIKRNRVRAGLKNLITI